MGIILIFRMGIKIRPSETENNSGMNEKRIQVQVASRVRG
jgi:hypothetical protein